MFEFVHKLIGLSTEGKLYLFAVVLLIAAIQGFILGKYPLVKGLLFCCGIQLVVAVGILFVHSKYNIWEHGFIMITSLFLSLIFQGVDFKKKEKIDPVWNLKIPVMSGKDLELGNIKRGIAIFGAAGAGKTESGFVPIIAHMSKYNFSGINYDYKDGELTEIVSYYFKDNTVVKNYVVAPARPEISDRLNPIAPEYIPSQETVNELVKVFFANSSGAKGSQKGGGNFFQEVPEATLAAVIWRLRNDYPAYCTLPHAIAVCLVKDPFQLADFISKNVESKIMAAPYLDSLAGQDQLAGVKGSLSNEMRKFAFPSVFYLLTGNDVNLRLNDPSSLGLLNVMNKPGLDETYSPFISVIVSSALNCMRERGKSPAMLLLDEGPTITLNKLSRIPATMRSYNIGTVYSMQDKVLGSEQQGDITTRAVLANLSYQLIGKANDAESIRYYKQLFAEIEKTSISRSYDSLQLAAGTRVTESSRTTSKYLNQDFSGLKTGEFLFLSDGEDRKVKIKRLPYDRNKLPEKNVISESYLQMHFHKIIEEAQNLV